MIFEKCSYLDSVNSNQRSRYICVWCWAYSVLSKQGGEGGEASLLGEIHISQLRTRTPVVLYWLRSYRQSRVLTNEVRFVLKGMSLIAYLDNGQWVWKYLIIHIRSLKKCMLQKLLRSKSACEMRSIETWTKLHRWVMLWIYVHFPGYVLGNMLFF